MWADGPEAGRPRPSVASRQSSIVGPEYGPYPRRPPPPQHTVSLRGGGQAWTGVEDAPDALAVPSLGYGGPHGAPTPSPGIDAGSSAPTHCSQSHKAALVPRLRGPAVSLRLCPPPPSTPTQESPERERLGCRTPSLPPPQICAPTHTLVGARGGKGG